MSLQVGQLHALLKLDASAFDRGLDQAESRGQGFLCGPSSGSVSVGSVRTA